jgi:beta-lactamase class A
MPFSVGLSEAIAARIALTPGAGVGVSYRPLAGAQPVEIDAQREFHAASTMKVPVMIEAFRRSDAGMLDLDRPLTLVNSFASLADGSAFSVDAARDSDSLAHQRVGRPVTVRELIEWMIVRSGNLATNAVIGLLDPASITATVRALGGTHMRVLRGVEDSKAHKAGLINSATAADLAALMVAIALDRAASPASCAEMRAILFRQEKTSNIPAGLPTGTRVANKTGRIAGIRHDMAIVYPSSAPPYVLAVCTEGLTDTEVARMLIVDISRLVWGAHSSPRASAQGRRAP